MADKTKIFGARSIPNPFGKREIKTSKVISAKKVNFDKKKIQVIGGDSGDFKQETPPAIIIEKDNDKISKIIVKCPCGRHSELVCEYDELEIEDTIEQLSEQKEV